MTILVMGNCQAEILASLFRPMSEDVETVHVRLLATDIAAMSAGRLSLASLRPGGSDIGTLIGESDLILIQDRFELRRHFDMAFPRQVAKARTFPHITFTGFHPDMIRLDRAPLGPTGAMHSSIVCYGWTNSLSVDQTLGLFREDVFEALGFFDYWDVSLKFLLDAGHAAALPLERLTAMWREQGVWMHSINHPKLYVLADVARAILTREGISFQPDVEHRMTDSLARRLTWSVYPEIARHIGVPGGYEFKSGAGAGSEVAPPRKYNLEGFVRASFEAYAGHGKEEFACNRLASPRYQKLARFLKKRASRPARRVVSAAIKPDAPPSGSRHPYDDRPDYQFWRRAIERIPMAEMDPVLRPRFTIKRNDKVATAGSCFAQHISRTLAKHGFNYYVTERGEDLAPEEAQRRNYGVFSARYGNLYTTRQLLQLVERAYGRFTPVDDMWVRDDGRLVDPFRPQIEPDGFATYEEIERSRAEHFKAVREMLETLDVLVFTFGLTEGWRSRIDGAVYPLAPGVAGGKCDPEEHEFVNFTAAEVTADMQAFVHRLVRVNPQARVILTVSPVPMIATYEDRHVLVSNTYTKSALRVVAEDISRNNSMCAYFPSYEVVIGNYARSEYYESDLRSVKPQGLDHVMRLFLAHYSPETAESALNRELLQENDEVADAVCDEEAIDN